MDSEFVNLYIEKLSARVELMTKNEIIYQVQLDLAKKATTALAADNEDLKQQINKLEASLNKRASKPTKEDF
jgi:hypothetical protein